MLRRCPRPDKHYRNTNVNTMEKNIPRAAIHAGKDKKSFSAQVSNEAERRGWGQKRYQQKNRDTDKNNHYNFSRKKLNFEISKGGKITSLGSNPIPAHQRLQKRLEELNFKEYMDADHPGQVADNSPNCTVGIIFSGDHDVMQKLAFGNQILDTSDPDADHSNITLKPEIFDWALDTYNFCCRKWGEENVISFAVHCDETSIHAHVQTVPVEKVKKRGRIGSKYTHKDDPSIVLSTKEWKALPKEDRGNYIKSEAQKDMVERVSYAKVWGEREKDRSEYLSQLHTDYHEEVGYKYGLARGIAYDELSPEEKRERKHKDKVTLEAERQAKQAIAEAEMQKTEIEEKLVVVLRQKEEAQKDLKNAQSGFIAKILHPDKHKREEAAKFNEAFEAGVKDTLEQFITASGLKWKNEPTPESLGRRFRVIWDSCKNLGEELKVKDGVIAAKDNEIKDLNLKITTLMEEVDGLKLRLTLVDENAVERLRNARNAEMARANQAERELSSLRSDYQNLYRQWNSIWQEPEMNEAWNRVKKRKEHEERLAVEAKRQEQARMDRRNNLIDRFIREGRSAVLSFANTSRNNFNEFEARAIYYGIIAASEKHNISLISDKLIEDATDKFLSGISWTGFTDYKQGLVEGWTKRFATSEVEYTSSAITNFISFIDHVTGSEEAYCSLSGSNGCADQLTNWDGTKKVGLGAREKKPNGPSR